MSHTLPTGEGYEGVREVIAAADRGVTPPAPEPAVPDGPEILDRALERIHTGPIRAVDVYVAVCHVRDGVILDGRDERSLRTASAWLADVEGQELLAETLEAFADQHNRDGIRAGHVREAVALSERLVFGDGDRFRELATVDPNDVL